MQASIEALKLAESKLKAEKDELKKQLEQAKNQTETLRSSIKAMAIFNTQLQNDNAEFSEYIRTINFICS